MRSLLLVCTMLLVLGSSQALAIVAPTNTPTDDSFPGDWSGDNWAPSTVPVYRFSGGGSCVSISATTVLMAAHLQPQVGNVIALSGAGPFYITEVDYSPSADLVLCKMSKPSSRWVAPYGGPIQAGPPGIGEPVEMVGYGYSGTCYTDGYDQNNATAKSKRWCTNSIDSAGSQLAMNYHAGDTEFEGGAAGSDSGSGTFVKVGNTWRTAGITTSISFNSQGQTNASYAVNLSDPAIYQWVISLTTLPGDTNFDDKVDFSDYLNLEANFGKTSGADYCSGDFTFDGKVTFADYLQLEANFGKKQLPAPEPATLSLLGFAVLWVVRRGRTTA